MQFWNLSNYNLVSESQNTSVKVFLCRRNSVMYNRFHQCVCSVNHFNCHLKNKSSFTEPSSLLIMHHVLNGLIMISVVIVTPCIFHLLHNQCNFYFYQIFSLDFKWRALVDPGGLIIFGIALQKFDEIDI